MSTKEQLVHLVTEWMDSDNSIKNMQKAIKEVRERKKLLTNQLVTVMKDNEIDCFDINDGKLVYSKSKTKQAVSKKVLLEALNKYFSDKPETANEIVDHILDSRTEKITETIKRK
tara:strand:+ start:10074 stop:10418 length:345 start_codon:yes stop_codon:yes gene_type:complete